jgi:protein SCO1
MNPPSPLRALRLLLWAAVPLAAICVVLIAMRSRPPRFHGTTYEPVAPAPEFALVDHRGRPATRDSLAGAPALLFFGYTRCPDVCPRTLSRLRRLTRDHPRVRVVLISVDPEHDTPAALARYVAHFGPGVTGLTGDRAAVQRAMAAYGAYTMAPVEHGTHGGGATSLSHSAVIYGLDRDGNLRVILSESASEDELGDDIRSLARL